MKKLLVLLLFISLSACSRTVYQIKPASTSNPERGLPVKIASVVDSRTFELAPRNPANPSLDSGKISDPQLTTNAIGRWRNGYGMALDNVYLEPGESVTDLVAERVTNALRRAGYMVLNPGDAQYDSAPALEVEINKLWGWMQPGAFKMQVNFDAEIELIGQLPKLKGSRTFTASANSRSMMIGKSDWNQTIDLGLKIIEDKIAESL